MITASSPYAQLASILSGNHNAASGVSPYAQSYYAGTQVGGQTGFNALQQYLNGQYMPPQADNTGVHPANPYGTVQGLPSAVAAQAHYNAPAIHVQNSHPVVNRFHAVHARSQLAQQMAKQYIGTLRRYTY